jgi:hypothetical protein
MPRANTSAAGQPSNFASRFDLLAGKPSVLIWRQREKIY